MSDDLVKRWRSDEAPHVIDLSPVVDMQHARIEKLERQLDDMAQSSRGLRKRIVSLERENAEYKAFIEESFKKRRAALIERHKVYAEASNAALEEAAKVADDHASAWGVAMGSPAKVIADAIRALKT